MITGKSEFGINDNVKLLIFVPGVQDSESRRQARRQARKLKRKDAELDCGDDLVKSADDDEDEGEEEDDDSDDDLDATPLSKRQRLLIGDAFWLER